MAKNYRVQVGKVNPCEGCRSDCWLCDKDPNAAQSRAEVDIIVDQYLEEQYEERFVEEGV
jgi:hypothetical protein